MKLRKEIDALFEKVSFGHDVAQVQRELNANPALAAEAKDLARGRALVGEGEHALEAARAGGRGLAAAGRAMVAPAEHVGPTLLKGLGSAGDYIRKSPALMRYGIGALALAPILGRSLSDSRNEYEAQAMSVRRDPSRVVTASLNDFLEKKAATASRGLMSSIGGGIRDSFASGVGGGIGKGLVDSLFGGAGKMVGGLKELLVTDGRRKQLLESVCRQDPVISDALRRNPDAKEAMLEAYGTMVRFAPSLSLDVNAVRSFLREVVLGGSGVNYATIKNLVETERAIKGGKEGR